jgi:DNA repair exonuclease SbcCD ATPase subunit
MPDTSLFVSLIAAAATVIAGLVGALVPIIQQRSTAPKKQLTYSERMNELNKSLTQASANVDKILQEMTTVTTEREEAVKKLEEQQKELESKITALQNVPVEAAEYFSRYLEKNEENVKRRDYRIFIYGVIAAAIVTVIITIILHFFGL